MLCRVLGSAAGVLGLLAHPLPLEPNPCREGRSLERQVDSADVVVFGQVTYDRDCPPFRVDSAPSRLELLGCMGRRADLVIQRSWKGPVSVGQGLLLTMPGLHESGGIMMRKGEKHVVFAKLSETAEAPSWLAQTSACMLPERSSSSDKGLVKRLDRMFK